VTEVETDLEGLSDAADERGAILGACLACTDLSAGEKTGLVTQRFK